MEDMENVINRLSDMLNSSDAPDNIKEMVQNMTTNSNSSNNTSTNSDNNNSDNIDIDTILKAKKIVDAMSNNKDPRKDLLLSLKPYLNDNKKEKIDKYIKFLTISKAFEVIGPEFLGSDKHA